MTRLTTLLVPALAFGAGWIACRYCGTYRALRKLKYSRGEAARELLGRVHDVWRTR